MKNTTGREVLRKKDIMTATFWLGVFIPKSDCSNKFQLQLMDFLSFSPPWEKVDLVYFCTKKNTAHKHLIDFLMELKDTFFVISNRFIPRVILQKLRTIFI